MAVYTNMDDIKDFKISDCNIIHLWSRYRAKLKRDLSETTVTLIETGKPLTTVQKFNILRYVEAYLKSDETLEVIEAIERTFIENECIFSEFERYKKVIEELSVAKQQYSYAGGRILPSLYETYIFLEHLVYYLEKQGMLYDYSHRYHLDTSQQVVQSCLKLCEVPQLEELDKVVDKLEALLEEYFDEKIKLPDPIYKYLDKVCRRMIIECKDKYFSDKR